MPIAKNSLTPKYRHHKPSGRAVVTIDNDYYLGPCNSQESNGTDVSAFAGRPVRLRFRVREADFFALRFA